VCRELGYERGGCAGGGERDEGVTGVPVGDQLERPEETETRTSPTDGWRAAILAAKRAGVTMMLFKMRLVVLSGSVGRT
jgi:hypothetical protein